MARTRIPLVRAADRLLSPSEILSGFCDPLLPALASGAAPPTDHLSKKLQKLASRLLPFTEGSFEPSEPPSLLETLTDELVVVAVDAVNTVCAAQTLRPSGKAQFRLLAWVVADARGALTPMDKALAETVGKRLDRQAQKVRSDLSLAVSAAQVDRDRAHARARVDASARASLQARLSEINETEHRAREKPSKEVYVGFHELESLLAAHTADQQRAQPPALPPALAAALRVADAADEAGEPEIPPIPDALAASLGRAGVQALWEFMVTSQSTVRESRDWHELVPHLVKNALNRSVAAYEEGRIDAIQDKLDDLDGQIKAAKFEDDLSTLWVRFRDLQRRSELDEKLIKCHQKYYSLSQKLLEKYKAAFPDFEFSDIEESESEQEG